MSDRTAEEWGRAAVALPGWRWMPGMLNATDGSRYTGGGRWAWDDPRRVPAEGIDPFVDSPDPDDPATEGCLLALLGGVLLRVTYTGLGVIVVVNVMPPEGEKVFVTNHGPRVFDGSTLGRACIAAAEALAPKKLGDL